MQVSAVILSLLLSNVAGFVTNKSPYRLQPVHENFFLDIAEDPAVNTPQQIFGEVAYKNFVAKNNPNGLPAWVFCTRYSDRPSAGKNNCFFND